MNIDNIKLKYFNIFIPNKYQKINQVYDKNVSIVNKLSNDLIKLSHLNDKQKYNDEAQEIINNSNNIWNRIKKEKIIKKEKKSFNKDNKDIIFLDEKNLFSFRRKINNAHKSNKKHNSMISYIHLHNKSLYNFKKNNKKYNLFDRTMTISSKRKINNLIKVNSKEQNSECLKNNLNKYEINTYSYDSTNNTKDEKSDFSFSSESPNKNNCNFKTLSTNQKLENNNLNTNKVNKINKYKFKKEKPYKLLLKQISCQKLSNLFNNSSNLYDTNYIKLKKIKPILSERKNYYFKKKFKNYKFSQNIKDKFELDYIANENNDIQKVLKTMKIYHNSPKNIINVNKKKLTNIMINKKTADMINCSDYYYNMDDLFFYKNKKIYFDYYPILSEKANFEPFKKNYTKIVYHSHKDKIDKNSFNIRRLVKSCKDRIKRLK